MKDIATMRANQHDNTSQDYDRARQLRNEASTVERRVWRVLSVQSAARGVKFRRQQVIHPFIADFACLSAKVLVELDGDSHEGQERQDKKRDAYLRRQGYDILRFSNQAAVTNTEGIVETILSFVENKTRGEKNAEME